MIPAIITARGGSKRIPRKNVKPFCGLSLLEWTIIQTQCSHHFDEVFLSTDDEQIAEIGKNYGVKIIWRTGIATGDISCGYVVVHAIQEIEKQGYEFDRMSNILPTLVCRHPNDFDRVIAAYERMEDTVNVVAGRYCPKEILVSEKASWRDDGDYCFPVIGNTHHRYYVGNACVAIAMKSFFIDHVLQPSKEKMTDSALTLRYEMYGWDSPMHFNIGVIETKWYQQFDIDNQDDWELCEWLFEKYILKGRGAKVYYDYKETK